MKNRKIHFALLLLIFIFTGEVLPLKISGSAKGFEQKFVRLYTIADFISYREVKLDVVKIESDGRFELNGHLLQPGLIKLKIDDKSLDLIVLPDFSLNLILNYDEEANKDHFFSKALNVQILDNSDLGLNKLLFEYQKIYAAFLEENHSALITKKILPKVYEFQKEMRQKYVDAPPYFKTYLDYDLASLEDAVLGSEKKLYDEQLKGRPVLYENIGYMKFFSQFYQDRFVQISQGKDGFNLLSAVNGTQNYQKMMDILNGHDFIDNDTIAQLFAILGLKEVYKDETFKKDKVLSMISTIKGKALVREHERMAENIIEELTFLKSGKTAPDFSLQDEFGKTHHLSDLAGRPVLVFFWSAYSNTCLRDIATLKEFHSKYQEKMEILFVNLDEDPSRALNYLDRNETPFLQLFKDKQYDLIDKYRVFSAPTYALIDRNGLVVRYPAKRPEENLEAEIYRLISEN